VIVDVVVEVVAKGADFDAFMPCLLSGGLIFLYCLGTAPAHVAYSNALGSLSAR
jgi:hypothetical protein